MSREIELLNIITKEGKVSVADLSRRINVSQVTIRKDLDQLEAKGLIGREHGFAVVLNADDLANRLARNYSTKRMIAERAAEMIQEGETVMIESGSCCALLAEEISRKKGFGRIITNSVFIANFIRDSRGINVTLLGGEFQRESQVNTGPMTKLCAGQFKVDKLFVGTDGFDRDSGFTGRDQVRTDTVRSMAESAKKVIVLTDSEKFGASGLVHQFSFDEISTVVTDNGISRVVADELLMHGISLVVAE
jgi:DeoR/GlpR family transcriptional regulator of sugar metabolism